MLAHGFTTIALVHAEHQRLFHARNPFAAGGVYEDPATGAALAGYLQDAGWLRDGTVDIIQGEDMGMRSRIYVEIPRKQARAYGCQARFAPWLNAVFTSVSGLLWCR